MGNENPTDTGWTPLSVRTGSRRKRFGWWLKGRRQALALKLAPWLTPAPEPLQVFHFHAHPTGTTYTQPARPETRP